MATQVWVGLDVGQVRDPSAIAVVERVEVTGEFDPAYWTHRKWSELHLRMLERIPLGTQFEDVVARVREVVQAPDLAGRCRVVADATGVGRPVMEMLERARLGCHIFKVMITGGNFEGQENGHYCVPKRDLITGLQVILQRGTLKIAAGMEEVGQLLEEMSAMQVKISLKGA